MRKATFLTFGLVVLMTGAVARADEKAKEEKFCAAITDFHSDMSTFDSLGPSSTVAELRAASDRISTDSKSVQKAASKIKTATSKEFVNAVDKLRSDAKSLPDNITIEQAKAKLDNDITKVKAATRKLTTESGCPDQAPATPNQAPATPNEK
jgi:hypothetical protein